MAGTEGVVAVNITHARQLGGESRLPRFLARIKTQVFQQEDFAAVQISPQFRSRLARGFWRELNGLAEQFGEACGSRFQAELRGGLSFGTAQVAHQNELAAAVKNRLDCRQSKPNSPIVGNVLLIVERNIEIDTHQNGFASYVGVRNCLFRHFDSAL